MSKRAIKERSLINLIFQEKWFKADSSEFTNQFRKHISDFPYPTSTWHLSVGESKYTTTTCPQDFPGKAFHLGLKRASVYV
jgi:hypothetical protein